MSEQPTRPSFPAGAVTRIDRTAAAPPAIVPAPASRPARWRPSAQVWWLGAAGSVLVIGVVVVIVLLSTGTLGSGYGPFSGVAEPPDVRPPLARLCPPPSGFGDPSGPTGPSVPAPAGPSVPASAPAGKRTVDEDAGISYPAYGAPWRPWHELWRMGTLGVPYGVGQHFVTETYPGGEYHASILSAAVPATVNDGMAIDVECTGRQVAADVRAEYYPQPNTMELMRDELITVGGRGAWVTKFRLQFHEPGLMATDELVGVAVIDVGRPTLAVLFVSIPGTHHEWDFVVDEVLASVRPL